MVSGGIAPFRTVELRGSDVRPPDSVSTPAALDRVIDGGPLDHEDHSAELNKHGSGLGSRWGLANLPEKGLEVCEPILPPPNPCEKFGSGLWGEAF